MKRMPILAMIVYLLAVFSFWCPADAAPPYGRGPEALPGTGILSGTVAFRERVELPLTAMVHVELIDLTQNDPRKALLGEDIVWPAGIKPPITFRISYDPSRIDPTHSYTVRARITDGEKTLFISSHSSPVLTKGGSNSADIIVSPVSISYR